MPRLKQKIDEGTIKGIEEIIRHPLLIDGGGQKFTGDSIIIDTHIIPRVFHQTVSRISWETPKVE